MKRFVLPLICLAASAGAQDKVDDPDSSPVGNPLVGAWSVERYVDTPEGGAPTYPFGERPRGLFIFTADGQVSINLMRDPPADAAEPDPDPDVCTPEWYCSYFGTYSYDPSGPTWTTRVAGANIANYPGSEQTRRFAIDGDLLTISETYTSGGATIQAERVLRRVGR